MATRWLIVLLLLIVGFSVPVAFDGEWLSFSWVKFVPLWLMAFFLAQVVAFKLLGLDTSGQSVIIGKGYTKLSDFIAVANCSEVADPGSMLVEIDERLVVLIHAAGHYYALDDVCTHDGGPLSDGPVDASDGTIACPRHGAKFDVKLGAAVTMPATKATISHEVKIEGEQVFVKLSDA